MAVCFALTLIINASRRFLVPDGVVDGFVAWRGLARPLEMYLSILLAPVIPVQIPVEISEGKSRPRPAATWSYAFT